MNFRTEKGKNKANVMHLVNYHYLMSGLCAISKSELLLLNERLSSSPITFNLTAKDAILSMVLQFVIHG